MNLSEKIYVAGHQGVAGSAIVRHLQGVGYRHLLLRTSLELDLRNQSAVADFFLREKPTAVILAAATQVADTASYLYDNLAITLNVMHQAYLHGVARLIFLSSEAIYPPEAALPLSETAWLAQVTLPASPPEAVVKLMGLQLCAAYRTEHGCHFVAAVCPPLYAPAQGVYPHAPRWQAAIAQQAPELRLPGPREAPLHLLRAEDLGHACHLILTHDPGQPLLNLGPALTLSQEALAAQIVAYTGYPGRITFDTHDPSYVPSRPLDTRHLTEMGVGMQAG